MLVTASIIVIQLLASPSQAYPASLIPSQGAYLGSWVAPRGDESAREALRRVESQIGRSFDIYHSYTKWNMSIPTATDLWAAQNGRIPMINWRAERTSGSIVTWSSIANGEQDGWIGERADAFRNFGYPAYLAFQHEPEDDSGSFGTPADYAAAFRHVVDVFNDHGVTNVAFVWNLMSWTFAPGSGRDPAAYYPGDSYVDIVGGDGYNWAPGRPGSAWTPFSQSFQHIYDWSVAHGKPLMAVEYGVQEDPSDPYRKAQWFQDALATIKSWPMFKASDLLRREQSLSVGHRQLGDVHGGIRGDGRGPVPERWWVHPVPDADRCASDSRCGRHPQQRTECRSAGAPIQAGGNGRRGDPFDEVSVTNGGSLTYDRHHARGRFSAKHVPQPGGDSYYGWTGTRELWFGRLYLRLKALPIQNLRLIRAASGGVLRCSIDVMPSGALQFNDQRNQPVVSTSIPVNTQRWVRIEWRVNHLTGKVEIKLFNRPNSAKATQVVRADPGSGIGSSADRFQFGRSGHQPFAVTFWTDDPALSSLRYPGPARR